MTFDDSLRKLVCSVHKLAVEQDKFPRCLVREVARALQQMPVCAADPYVLLEVLGCDHDSLVVDLVNYRPRADLLMALDRGLYAPDGFASACSPAGPKAAPKARATLTRSGLAACKYPFRNIYPPADLNQYRPETDNRPVLPLPTPLQPVPTPPKPIAPPAPIKSAYDLTWEHLRALNRECFERQAAAERRSQERRGAERAKKGLNTRVERREDRPLSAVLYDAAERGSLQEVQSIGQRLQRARDGLDGKCDRISGKEALLAGGVGPDGWTGLMRAALFGFAPVVDELLALGADPAKQNLYGQTALELAIVNGHRACAKALLAPASLRLHDFRAARSALKNRWDELLDMEVIRELVEHDAVRRAELESELETREEQVSVAEANALESEAAQGMFKDRIQQLEANALESEAAQGMFKYRIQELERERDAANMARLNENAQRQLRVRFKVDLATEMRREAQHSRNAQAVRQLRKENFTTRLQVDAFSKEVKEQEGLIETLRAELGQKCAQASLHEKTLVEQVGVQQEIIDLLTAEIETREATPTECVLDNARSMASLDLETKATPTECEQTDDPRSTISLDMVFIGDDDDQAASESDDWFFADTPITS